MVSVHEAIVVEGRYDKNTLSQVVQAPIFQTDGFGIMKNAALLNTLRDIARIRGLIIFTDSDGAGFVIRNYLKSAIPAHQLKHAYIPDVYGKERRKSAPGREGKLGVEGMSPDVLLECLRKAGATFIEQEADIIQKPSLTKQDLFALGLSGSKNSSVRRKALLTHLNLPQHMSCNAMLQALSLIYSKEELSNIVMNELEIDDD